MLARNAAKGRASEAAVVDSNGLLSPGPAPPLAGARDRQLARKHRHNTKALDWIKVMLRRGSVRDHRLMGQG